MSIYDDPFMPAARRFPRNQDPRIRHEPPSDVRPFVLRGAQEVPSVITGRHRTAPQQTPHTDPTTYDGTTVADTWYEPDD